MIQAGDTSYSSISPLFSKSGTPKAASKKALFPQKPRFGSSFTNASVDRLLIPTFQNITENFLWGFIGIDFACMWLPRTLTALTTGAIPYDPNKDPKAKNLPFHKQTGRWVKGTAEGLNWSNLQEETKREVASGPGSVAISAIMFLAVRHLWNKRTVEMSHPALEGLSQGFEAHLRANPSGKAMDNRAFREALAGYVDSVFTDPALRATRLDTVIDTKHRNDLREILSNLEHPGSLDEEGLHRLQASPVAGPILGRKEGLSKRLRSLLGRPPQAISPRELEDIRQELSHRPMLRLLSEPDGSKQTYDDYLKRWSKTWAETALDSSSGSFARKERLKQLKALSEDLTDTLEAFNKQHRILQYDTSALAKGKNDLAAHIRDAQPLHQTSKTWVRYTPEYRNALKKTVKPETPVQKDLSELTGDLGRWADFAQSAWKKQEADPEKDPSEMVDKLRKQMVTYKFGLAVLGTGLAAAYMIHLAAWCQNHGAYQATRTLNRKKQQGNSTPDNGPNVPPSQFSRNTATISAYSGQQSPAGYPAQTMPSAVQAMPPINPVSSWPQAFGSSLQNPAVFPKKGRREVEP